MERELHAQFSRYTYQWYELVNWREPLIVGAISFHIALAALVVCTRKNWRAQCALFALLIALLAVTERVNTWARTHWRLLATQQYFDTHGIFMAIFYAAPLLVIGFLQLTLNMKTIAAMVVTVKRAELQQKRKAAKAAETKPHAE